jgi:hypothetical protein
MEARPEIAVSGNLSWTLKRLTHKNRALISLAALRPMANLFGAAE